MGLISFLRGDDIGIKALTASPSVIEAAQGGHSFYQRLGGSNLQEISSQWQLMQSANYAWMYQHQPSVRRVIDYIASNVAQISPHLYEKVSDDERVPAEDHPAAETLRNPNDLGPADLFILNLVSDYLVHDNAYALKFRGGQEGPRKLIQVPAHCVAVNASGRFTIDSYWIYLVNGEYFDVPPGDMLHWRRYNPDDPKIGYSRLETLRQILAESAAATAAASELYKSGLSSAGYIKRSLEAPEWSQEARKRFQRSWDNQAKTSSRETPVLEEGMEFEPLGISPHDAEMLAAREFTNEEVAGLYGMKNVPPEGDEERKQFYADVLPPITESLAEQLDFSILRGEYFETDFYYEFNLNEKLRGDPVARFQAITTAAGGPWLTRNEARALENKPPIDGGDELITPLNVVVGDNPRPAPTVMPIQDPNQPPQDGSYRESGARREPLALEPGRKALMAPRHSAAANRRDNYAEELKAVLVAFYTRQENAITSKGIKAPFQIVRWNRELSAELLPVLQRLVEREGDIQARHLGLFGFDTRQVVNYLQASADDIASGINDATRAELREAKPADVFARARDTRSVAGSMTTATAMAAFANGEAAKQAPGTARRQKMWVVTSDNSEHPEMDGETVPLGSTFSNGAEGPPADHPGCQCLLDIA